MQRANTDARNDALVVGHDERDDAAVYDLGDGTGVISTTDFFMPVVDDAFDYGRIASINALSDVWAMGGTPLMALAVLGWPIERLPAELANAVLEGARSVCRDVGVVLAGGHSVDNQEPLFGLAVTGRVQLANLKRNSTGLPGDILVLTKPIGTGILTTASKRGLLSLDEGQLAIDVMLHDNRVGSQLSTLASVHAVTDVTGFGLLGHAHEMALGASCEVVIDYASVPQIDAALLDRCVHSGAVPGGTKRNWEAYGHQVQGLSAPTQDVRTAVLCDPQTAGGLLISVAPEQLGTVQRLLIQNGYLGSSIGRLEAGRPGRISVAP